MRTAIITFTLGGVMLAGCHQEVSHKLFERESDIHDMDRFAAAQSAAGARQDGMLYAHHFSGAELNSLGRSKLHLMAEDKPATEPLAVYVNTTNDPLAHERETAVEKYLKEHGLSASDVQIKMGANPKATYSASAALGRLSKTESGTAESSADWTASGGGSSSNTGAKPSNNSK